MVHVIPGWSRESVGTGRVASRGLSGSQPKDPDAPRERPEKRAPGCLGYIGDCTTQLGGGNSNIFDLFTLFREDSYFD